jgi:hypothetical protein
MNRPVVPPLAAGRELELVDSIDVGYRRQKNRHGTEAVGILPDVIPGRLALGDGLEREQVSAAR